MCWLLAVVVGWFPFGGLFLSPMLATLAVLPPVLAWQSTGRRDLFLRESARQALRLALSWTVFAWTGASLGWAILVAAILVPVSFQTAWQLIGTALWAPVLLLVVPLLLTIPAVVQALRGRVHRPPLVLPLLLSDQP